MVIVLPPPRYQPYRMREPCLLCTLPPNHSSWKLSPVPLERGKLAGESRTSPEFHPSFRTPLVESILT